MMFSADEFDELTDLGMTKPGSNPTEVVNAKTGAVSANTSSRYYKFVTFYIHCPVGSIVFRY